MTPAVSVIIPTFNRANLIGHAIESVLRQTYASYEIVVVDDGSTDDTAGAVARFGERVRYVNTPHRGVAHARNVGFQQARGRYWTFLDSDDLLYPYALELGATVLDRCASLGFVCSEMSGFDDAGFFERYHVKTYHRSAFRDPSLSFDRIFQSSANIGEMGLPLHAITFDAPDACTRRAYFGDVFDTYVVNLVLAQNTAMIRREALETVGGVDERIRHWDVVDLLLRVCRRFPICYVDVPTYKLRYHANQTSGTNRADGRAIWLRKQWWLLRVTKRHATADPDYYSRHRARLDRHIAGLYRAAAIPMLVVDRPVATVSRYDRRARVFLSQSARLGHPERALWCISYLPRRARRFAIGTLQHARNLWRQIAHAPVIAAA